MLLIDIGCMTSVSNVSVFSNLSVRYAPAITQIKMKTTVKSNRKKAQSENDANERKERNPSDIHLVNY